PWQLRGPAELALDLLDELADLGGGGFRLLALDADERRLVLLIIEEDVENTVGYQRDTDDRDEQRDVFGKQASAGFCAQALRHPLAAARQRQRLPVESRHAKTWQNRERSWRARYQTLAHPVPVPLETPLAHSITSSASAITVGGTVQRRCGLEIDGKLKF